MALRVSIDESAPVRSTGLKGLGSVSATEKFGPGAELAADGELPATMPAVSVGGPTIGGLLLTIAVVVAIDYVFFRSEKE